MQCPLGSRVGIVRELSCVWPTNIEEARILTAAERQRPKITLRIPTVRRFSERHASHRLIRINLRGPNISHSHGVGLEGAAAATLKLLDLRVG
jgi:hypothetical protein